MSGNNIVRSMLNSLILINNSIILEDNFQINAPEKIKLLPSICDRVIMEIHYNDI